jgi:tetrahydrodipicolinate N-succinyltransferase
MGADVGMGVEVGVGADVGVGVALEDGMTAACVAPGLGGTPPQAAMRQAASARPVQRRRFPNAISLWGREQRNTTQRPEVL